MIRRGSRYQDSEPFRPPEEGSERSFTFRGLRPRRITPAQGVVEHVVREGDRLDALAHHYYNDSRLWYRILDANPELLSGADATRPETVVDAAGDPLLAGQVGRSLRIPRARG
ncbi:MAG: tail protein X [Acidobacteriota bacterium]